MNKTCEDMRRAFLALEISQEQCRQAHRVVEHLRTCGACQQAINDYEAMGSLLAPVQAEEREPRGGWEALEGRLAESARAHAPHRLRVPLFAVAAGLALLLSVGFAFLASHRSAPAADDAAALLAPRGADQTDASLTKAFATVSSVFDGRATWVMISDKTSDMGVTEGGQTGSKLLLLRLVASRGGQNGASMCLAIVPGSTARVTVPSVSGENLQYTIVTDAKHPERVSVAMTVDSSGPASSASITTTLNLPFGKNVHVGQVATQSGPVNLLASLQQSTVATKGV